ANQTTTSPETTSILSRTPPTLTPRKTAPFHSPPPTPSRAAAPTRPTTHTPSTTKNSAKPPPPATSNKPTPMAGNTTPTPWKSILQSSKTCTIKKINKMVHLTSAITSITPRPMSPSAMDIQPQQTVQGNHIMNNSKSTSPI